MEIYSWRKGFFSNTYSIFKKGLPVGNLRTKSFSSNASAYINGKQFNFITKGFINQSALIIERNSNKVIGKITFNSWRTKANIEFEDTIAELKSNNIWNSSWLITGNRGETIRLKNRTTNGTIESTTDDERLLMAGLFATNYYQQVSIAIFIAIFMPLYISILSH